jgi:hypothetical protein
MQQKATDFLLRALQEGVAGLPTGKPSYNADAIWQDRRYAGSGRFGVLAYGAYVLARESKAPLATLRQLSSCAPRPTPAWPWSSSASPSS